MKTKTKILRLMKMRIDSTPRYPNPFVYIPPKKVWYKGKLVDPFPIKSSSKIGYKFGESIKFAESIL